MTLPSLTPKQASDAIRALMRGERDHPQLARLPVIPEKRTDAVALVLACPQHVEPAPGVITHYNNGGHYVACERFHAEEVTATMDGAHVTCFLCRKELMQ
jgi:hypothetical protein